MSANQSSIAPWQLLRERWLNKPMQLGLERVTQLLTKLEQQTGLALQRPDAVVITVGGTNGKGSTCAMLEFILTSAGFRVGCYTSPDLLSFRERIRIAQESISDADLTTAFEAVAQSDVQIDLTPFEAETLTAAICFARASVDVWVLEVGLGGRLDAVNAFDSDAAIITCVDLDHTAILGKDREAIGFEKAHIYRPHRPAICADPLPPKSLIHYATQIRADLWLFGRDFNYSGDKQQWAYGGRVVRRHSMAYPALRGANQLLNASAALAAIEALKDRLAVSQQAVRQGLSMVEIPGRFQVLAGRPVVVLDVGHNPHAAAHLAANLDQMGFFPYTHAVLGMLSDKDIDGVIAHLKGKVDYWWASSLTGPRATTAAYLAERLRAAGVRDTDQSGITLCDTPSQALLQAKAKAGENDRIIVFGSFLTVADVLRQV
jgi:dihydrofolate synthase / folylpolyglutamate synthase